MTDLSRRSFLRGFLTVAAVSIAPALPDVAPSVPRIVGDGIHDDTAGLQAALDGKPFICEGNMVLGGRDVRITGGSFRVTSTLHVRRSYTSITGSAFDGRGIKDGPVIHWHPSAEDISLFHSNYIQSPVSA